MQENQIIILEQLPIIVERLDSVSKEVKEKVERAKSLVVTEESVKEVKQVRANLTKEFNELETQRKNIKNAIMEKYNAFEDAYKSKISNLYKEADAELKGKIDSVENQLKLEKEVELREFANQHIEANNLQNIIEFKDIGLNITLSASMKSLKDQILDFVTRVSNDLECISSDEDKVELLYTYQNNGFDYANAVLTVRKKKEELKRLEELQKQKQEIVEQEQQVVENVEEVVEDYITIPKELLEDEDLITVSFEVTGTKEQIKKIKDLIIELGVEYK